MKSQREIVHAKYHQVLTEAKSKGLYREQMASLARNDLFFLLVYVLHRDDVDHDWLYDRCVEVQAEPDGYLDLWSRDHYKSTIISYGMTIQDILNDPEITVGIFSHTRPIAKSFLRQIKRELEGNSTLKFLFPDVLWESPHKEAPKWSEDDGIVVKRKSNPKESTVEAWGLVDGQPTGRHFKLMVYDDVVTRESVTTPDMIKKVTEAWELSRNLISSSGGNTRYIGTRYHFGDTYKTIMERGAAIPRIYPATKDGTAYGEPVLLTAEKLAEKRRDMGVYTFNCHASGTLITMSDWSQKPIEDIVIGDSVVGFVTGKNQRTKLVEAKVLATSTTNQDTVVSTLETGATTIHTKDHLWWTGRTGKDTHRTYAELGFGYHDTKFLCMVFDINEYKKYNHKQSQAAAYLAGIIDGEGCISGGSIHIAQDSVINIHVCNNIDKSLTELGLEYTKHPVKRKKRSGLLTDFVINGGRKAKLKVLWLCKDWLAKKDKLAQSCFGARNFGRKYGVKLLSQEPYGTIPVYNIQTSTGNYIANGFCSKNCQMMQNPAADGAMGFLVDWLRYWEAKDTAHLNKYILCDPANEKKKTNDYTCFMVIGLGEDSNIYVIDIVRDRLSLTERANTLFKLHKQYLPLGVGYEKYGMQSDIEHFKDRMNRENYRFEITALGGNISKIDRIRTLVPLFENFRIYLPERIIRTNYEGITQELVKIFVDDEYLAFPVAVHDDMLDCLARVNDPAFLMRWPDNNRIKREIQQMERELALDDGGWMTL